MKSHIKEVVELYISGKTLDEIAAIKNCHPSTVWRYLAKAKCPRRRSGPRRKLSLVEHQELLSSKKLGMTNKELSNKFRLAQGSVNRYLRRLPLDYHQVPKGKANAH